MAEVKGLKKIGSPYGNEVELVRVVYDFAEDTGALGTYDLLKSQGICHVRLLGVMVETAVTSGGTPTFDIGIEGGVQMYSNLALTAIDAVGDFAQPASLATAQFFRVTDGQDVTFVIETATVTAGKLEFVFEVIKGF